jgi:hypothetical protein
MLATLVLFEGLLLHDSRTFAGRKLERPGSG